MTVFDASSRRLQGVSGHEQRMLCSGRQLEGEDGERGRSLCVLPRVLAITTSKTSKRRLQDGNVTTITTNAQVAFEGTYVTCACLYLSVPLPV